MNRLLFLCSGNYYRSRYAEELFNYKARTVLSNWWADSRGICLNPNNRGAIAQVVLNWLASLGVNPSNASRPPEAVKQSDLDDSALVIAMSRQEHYPLMRRMFPAHAEQIGYWDVEDTGGMPPDVALSKVELRVDELINRISRLGHAP